MAKVLIVASEAIPFAKTGGLADVIGALPPALTLQGHEMAVLMPRHGALDLRGARRVYESLQITLGAAEYETSLYETSIDGVTFYFLDCPPLFDRAELYGGFKGDFEDNDIRFAVLAHSAFTVSRHLFRPDILHCHDWQAALVPTLLRSTYANDPTFFGIKTLFTIHNLGYQGLFPRESLQRIGLRQDLFHIKGLEFFGRVNFLKGALYYSDALNTVSPTYSREIQTAEFGFGLDGVLRERSEELYGILNGVDYRDWDPATDFYIAANYSAGDPSGKVKCKEALLQVSGLPQEAIDRPLIGIVSRLTGQKGADLLLEIAPQFVGDDLYLVALGSGDPVYEQAYIRLANAYPGRIAVRIGYDNRLAHQIEAGADMFLMPSRYEPCGLNQMYSLRYGTVPIVHATGGLDDAIDEDTGYKMKDYSSSALLSAIREASAAFSDSARWAALRRRGMVKDFSWNTAAKAYSALYGHLLKIDHAIV